VVHSGMRGDNILITDSGGAMLGGFGLTKVRTIQGSRIMHSVTGGGLKALQSSTGNDKIPPAVMTGKSESQRWMVSKQHNICLHLLTIYSAGARDVR
jgi:hypothetical protein